MNATTVIAALFGAALVAIGVLAAALADRIRGTRPGSARAMLAPREVTPRAMPRAMRQRQRIEVVEPESDPVPTPMKPTRPGETKEQADDVIAALVAAGYKKSRATEATWGCSQTERVTIELWTKAALRRCAQGGVS